MRYSRIIAAIVFSSALILACVFPSSANETDKLVCDSGVGHFVSANSSLDKWVDYIPDHNSNLDSYTFPNIPEGITSGNTEYAFNSFTFLTYSYDTSVTLERGYIYTFNFQISSTQISSSNASRTVFSFGMCEDGYTNGLPLSSVTYTYSTKAGRTIFNCTAIVNVDGSIDFSGLTSNDAELYYYLQMSSPWSDSFTLTASNMTKVKSLGEESYYQASVDAIKGLPESEYNYILNKMPDAEGELTVMSGELLDIMAEFSPELKRGRDLFTSDVARPCVYLPDIDIPFLNIHVMDKGVRYLDTYLNEMNPMILEWIAVVLNFVRLVVCVTFFTSTWYKMARIEWWY